MSTHPNPIEIVSGIYAAFGRNDIPAILDRMHPDIEWEYGIEAPDVPWLTQRRGVDGVRGFFEALAAVDFKRFEVKRIVGDDDLVVGMVDVEFVHRKTGRKVIEIDEVHLWTFDAGGKAIRFCHRCDTLQHWAASTGHEVGAVRAVA